MKKGDNFKFYSFEGSYKQIGHAYGEELRDEIRKYSQKYREGFLKDGKMSADELDTRIRAYFGPAERDAPDLVDQLDAMAEGAGITREDAMLIQINRELESTPANGNECTSFCFGEGYTADGKVYSGENGDNGIEYIEKSAVVSFAVTGKPRITFVLPVGNISFHGMNSEGISCNHNLVVGSPWKKGFPRLFVSRLALEQRTMEDVCRCMDQMDFISSRHFLFADYKGNIVSYEIDSQGFASVKHQNHFIHTNHFMIPEMKKYETKGPRAMRNSYTRLAEMERMAEEFKGNITVETIEMMLRSRENGQDSICVVDRYDGAWTAMSIINCLNDGKMLVAKGTPDEHEYIEYPV